MDAPDWGPPSRPSIPRALHQRCWVHKMRNILEKVRKRDYDAVKADAQAIYLADGQRPLLGGGDSYSAFGPSGITLETGGGPVQEAERMAATVRAMRPMVPAKDFRLSSQFYTDLGFQPSSLAQGLVEMSLGAFSIILQDYYVEQWANNFVMHLRVSDVAAWWKRIVDLDLAVRYSVCANGPHLEPWGLVVDICDPSGVLWRIA